MDFKDTRGYSALPSNADASDPCPTQRHQYLVFLILYPLICIGLGATLQSILAVY